MPEQREPAQRKTDKDPVAIAARVAAAVDPLLADVWLVAWATAAEDGEERLATLLRMAYLQGYGDAIVESKRGELFARLGVGVPAPATTPSPRARRRPRS